MKQNDKILKLTYGVFVCTLIGFIFSISLGVKDKEIYNYLIAASNCFLLSTINCILMLKESSKLLKRKLDIKEIIISVLPYSLISFMLGLIYMLILDEGFDIKICKVSRFITALYQTFVALVISTTMADNIITKYEESIKNKKV